MSEHPTTTASGSRISRRAFMFGGTVIVLGVAAVSGALVLQPALKALVDTIIPADEFGPAASETGAVEAIWSSMQGRLADQLRLRIALAWLNLRAGGSFAAAGEAKRNALLNELAGRPIGDQRRRFFDWIRARTMQHYYGSAARAKALGFVGPPQPNGYPDAAAPWKRHA
jgi:Gluconate 2-dehydrogenase subunit 3